MIHVRLLLFALYRDLAGADAVDLTLPAGSTAGALVAELRRRGGGFARIPPEPVVAVNHEYSPLETVLANGDEVALIPPVAGG